MQWSNEKDKRSTKHTHKTKDRVTRTPLIFEILNVPNRLQYHINGYYIKTQTGSLSIFPTQHFTT